LAGSNKIAIRCLTASDTKTYWLTRNQGLLQAPDAFTSSHEEGLAIAPERLALRFGGPDNDDFVIGAFSDQGQLAGYVGFERETRIKARHKGTVIGMYVIPAYRGHRLGHKLLDALISHVRTLQGMEQINLSVTQSNEGARSLYLAAGFVPYGLEKRALKIGDKYYDKEYLALML
jgi:ribosomal protein S18 acetylase RimI-like enzyme